MAAWISSLSLATLAILAAITAYLGWRRAALFREAYSSLSIELTRERVWADDSLTLLVLSARLKNTSQVLVRIESVNWELSQMVPGTGEVAELFGTPQGEVSFQDFWLEPQEEDVVFSEIWLATPETPQPVFGQVTVQGFRKNGAKPRGWIRRIHFVLEDYYA